MESGRLTDKPSTSKFIDTTKLIANTRNIFYKGVFPQWNGNSVISTILGNLVKGFKMMAVVRILCVVRYMWFLFLCSGRLNSSLFVE